MRHIKIKPAHHDKWQKIIDKVKDCDEEIIVTLDDDGGPITGGGSGDEPIPPTDE